MRCTYTEIGVAHIGLLQVSKSIHGRHPHELRTSSYRCLTATWTNSN